MRMPAHLAVYKDDANDSLRLLGRGDVWEAEAS